MIFFYFSCLTDIFYPTDILPGKRIYSTQRISFPANGYILPNGYPSRQTDIFYPTDILPGKRIYSTQRISFPANGYILPNGYPSRQTDIFYPTDILPGKRIYSTQRISFPANGYILPNGYPSRQTDIFYPTISVSHDYRKIEAGFRKPWMGAFETRYLLFETAKLSTLETATWTVFSYSQPSHAHTAMT